MNKLLKLALLLFPLTLWAQYPQVPLTGNIGSGGVFPLINSPSVVFATDANHTMTYPEMSGSGGFIQITSSTALSATRNLVAPLVKGFTWAIENTTTGGHSIQVIGATGTGVTIANGYTITVYCDGTNYVTLPSASGGTVLSVTGTAPVSCTGGANVTCAMAQANGSTNGYLASADWTTFNGKQNALGYTPAHAGANSDITSLSGMTTPLPTSEGGTGGAGGTGYAYGNGAGAFSYSPTIPCASVAGANCSGVGSLPSYTVTLIGQSTSSITTACISTSCTSIAGVVTLSSSTGFPEYSDLLITPTNSYPQYTFCRANFIPAISPTPTDLIFYFDDTTNGASSWRIIFTTSVHLVRFEYTCTLNGPPNLT